MKWPGKDLSSERQHQYIEYEFMKSNEYPLLINDPSDFMLRFIMPRMFKNFKSLEKLPQFATAYFGEGNVFINFALPEIRKLLKTLKKAGELSAVAFAATRAVILGPMIQGFPQFFGSFTLAPFDVIGDLLRSTYGIMSDIYQHPVEVIEACNVYANILIKSIFLFSSSPFVFIPLHKGADNFMSVKQFETFYWPSLKKMMLGFVNEGLIPILFAEGSYNKRLEIISDFSKNSCIWYFDQIDMYRAKKILGNICTIMGNVPSSLTVTGTPEQMKKYCYDLIEKVGNDGNFILSNGCQVDNAKEENLIAMIKSVKNIGIF